MYNSLQPHGLQPTRLLRPWDFPGKSIGVGCHFLLQRIFLTQGLNPGLLQCRQTLYSLSHMSNYIAVKWITWKEMDRFLEKFSLPRLNQEGIEIMNNPITSTEIEAVIKNLPKNKGPRPNGFTGECYQTFREDLMPILLKHFQKNHRGRNTSKLIL